MTALGGALKAVLGNAGNAGDCVRVLRAWSAMDSEQCIASYALAQLHSELLDSRLWDSELLDGQLWIASYALAQLHRLLWDILLSDSQLLDSEQCIASYWIVNYGSVAIG